MGRINTLNRVEQGLHSIIAKNRSSLSETDRLHLEETLKILSRLKEASNRDAQRSICVDLVRMYLKLLEYSDAVELIAEMIESITNGY